MDRGYRDLEGYIYRGITIKVTQRVDRVDGSIVHEAYELISPDPDEYYSIFSKESLDEAKGKIKAQIDTDYDTAPYSWENLKSELEDRWDYDGRLAISAKLLRSLVNNFLKETEGKSI